jgi:5-methyltetrahydropteroyltriglutamate--homocysteine methyltransferase
MSLTVDSGTLGFPRMGPNRELKFALEKFWRGKLSEEELYKVAHAVEAANWTQQLESGVARVAVGLFSLYDHVLDWTYYLGLAPERFQKLPVNLTQYFAMARGVDGIPALDMTKWFDTNYHYEVPELSAATTPKANFATYLSGIERALAVIGPNKTVPVVLGPLTYLSLAKFVDGVATFESLLEQVLPLYTELFAKLAALGVREVQVHEPSLVTVKADHIVPFLSKVYGNKSGVTGALSHSDLSLNLVTYFEEISTPAYQWFANDSTISAISLDFTRGDNLALLTKFGFPAGKRLGAGLIDGRSIWKFNPEQVLSVLEQIKSIVAAAPGATLTIQTSSSLQHVPYTTQCEVAHFNGNNETQGLAGVLSFAYEKLHELELLKTIALNGEDAARQALDEAKKAWAFFYEKNPAKKTVQDRLAAVQPVDFERPSPFAQRRPKQLQGLPPLPTTTIGSFPQTAQIRALRRKLKSGEISLEHYQNQIDQQIAFNMGIQESLGLDILVHGEPERTDMVEYFAEKLQGFAFTTNGWVQSYGSRCVRPPVIFADLERPAAMTVREFVVAQSFTTKPVKGMLTGPVTILNWSFPRKDITRKQQAFQLALCLRDEVKDLEDAKCAVIQVDEPALREGMPLKAEKKDEYLQWGVDAFRLSTAIAKDETSIHTHMCYCEFHDCMHAIDAIDADVNSIENARSDDETIRSFKSIGYQRDLGPGTYDIHSPVVPPTQQIVDKLESFLKLLPASQVVVNPDCGLKTRKWPETIAALKNMVDATRIVRAKLA